MLDFNHRPFVDINYIIKHYSKKDGVPIKYVCSTALDNDTSALDVFYRDTPHPVFGNKYFGIGYSSIDDYFISNADKVEDLYFTMIKDQYGIYHYSKHRHDFVSVGGAAIDGGRAYTRIIGDFKETKVFKVKDGEFVECQV